MGKTCAITGHRPAHFTFGYDEKSQKCHELKMLLFLEIVLLYRKGVTRFLTGCALGVDMWAAETIIGLMQSCKCIKLYSIIPYKEQAERWSPQQQERYRSILKKSTRRIYISRDYSDDCYAKRNRYLVDHADVLLAVFNPSETGKSGTRYTVEYALKKGIEVIYADPTTALAAAQRGSFS